MQTVFTENTSEQMALLIQSHCSACQVLHSQGLEISILGQIFQLHPPRENSNEQSILLLSKGPFQEHYNAF